MGYRLYVIFAIELYFAIYRQLCLIHLYSICDEASGFAAWLRTNLNKRH